MLKIKVGANTCLSNAKLVVVPWVKEVFKRTQHIQLLLQTQIFIGADKEQKSA